LSRYRVESSVIVHPEELKPQWLDLQSRADGSYFLSWGWIGTWLAQIAVDLRPVVVKVWSDENLVGMGLFVSRDIKRHVLIHSRSLFLNEYPFDHKNMVIEYNGLLAQRDFEDMVYANVIGHLLQEYGQYDEFHFGAIADDSSLVNLEKSAGGNVDCIINEESISWQVDLSGFAAGMDAYLASLSKNRRAQIWRSIRLYEEQGQLQLDEAGSTEEALSYFGGLKVLHTERWQSKGGRGSFANSQWEEFHRALIQARFDKGEIQLLKISNSISTIGYLYNFLWHKRVYVQQTGFRIPEDKRFMPGYVAHTLGIVHNKAKGMAVYDLMHGDSLYKRLLCNRSQKLYWVALQRNRLKFVAEKMAAGLVRRLRD